VTTANAQPKRAESSEPGAVFTALTTAALLALAAFFIGAQSNGTRGGIVEVLAVLLATAIFGRAAFNDSLPRPFNASLGVLLLSLFAGVTALSVGWSLLPNASMLDAVRLISYTCVLALAAMIAQLYQGRSRELLIGIGLAALLVVSYGLASHCIPGIFPSTDNFARIRLPFGYWNAVGTIAAIGLVTALWAGTRRSDSRWLEIASYPAGGLFVVTLMLTQSRAALLSVAIVLGLWILLVPQRLRSTGWLAIVGFFSMIVVAWAYNKTALSTDAVPFDQRKSTGIQLLIFLIVLSGLLAAAGALVYKRRNAHALPAAQRYKIGRVLLILLAISPFVFTLGVTVGTQKGFSTIPDGIGGLFSSTATAPDNSPDRLTQTTSLRGRYWSDADKIFGAHTFHGTGGDTFVVARLPYRHDQIFATHAHGMVPQVASDLGVVGLTVLLLITIVWLVAAFKLAGASKKAPWKWLNEADEVRLASVAIMLTALLFGLHSALDWVWFLPGVAYFGLLAGGWTLGSPSAHSAREDAPGAERVRGGKLQIVRACAIAIIGIAIAYAVYQPVRAEEKASKGLELAQSNPAKAEKLGRESLKLDPTSADAFILISVAQSNAGNKAGAEATLEKLTAQQPGNPASWLRLARFRLMQLNHPDSAILALRPLLYQSPNNLEGLALLDAARQAKTDILLQKVAEAKRKELKKQLDALEKLQKAAANGTAVTPPPGT
jgi:hypothetical protein